MKPNMFLNSSKQIKIFENYVEKLYRKAEYKQPVKIARFSLNFMMFFSDDFENY